METKTKHRLLGLVVLAGLVIIIYPFLDRGKDLSVNTAAINPPPFPDQSIQLEPDPEVASTINAASPPSPTTPVENTAPAPSVSTTSITNAESPPINDVKALPDDVIKTQHAADPKKEAPAIGATNPSTNNNANNPSSNDVKSSQQKSVSSTSPSNKQIHQAANKQSSLAKHSIAKVEKPSKKLLAANKHKAGEQIADNELFKIQEAAWVIQVGSFKNKANALRVVNRLRANGYSAFLQQFSSNAGLSTRVFVGPENKQASARLIAQELEKDQHLHGIVISYTPLAL